jgi:hypothetical protein
LKRRAAGARICHSIFDRASRALAIALPMMAASAPPPRRSIPAIVIVCEINLSRGGLARLLAYPHVN